MFNLVFKCNFHILILSKTYQINYQHNLSYLFVFLYLISKLIEKISYSFLMESDDEINLIEQTVINSGLTFFPSLRQCLTLTILIILEAEAIFICMPLRSNSNLSFLIVQIILFSVVLHSWYLTLKGTPGPMTELFTE